MSEAVLRLEGIRRTFRQGEVNLEVLRGATVRLERGEVVALVGPSGAGKSTLLHIAGLLERPDAGGIVIDGVACEKSSEAERTRTRRRKLGFVYQFHHLLPEFSALENVALPQRIAGRRPAEAKARARELLERLGLGGRLTHRPARLSGGEQQRVAIAVALANRPTVLLADEPTGELDSATSTEVFGLLRRVNEELGTTIVVVTHDPLVSERVQRTVAIRDGRTSSETFRRTELADDGNHRVIAEEFAVLDRAGRLQLPRAHVDALELRNRVRLRLEEDHVGVWPDRDAETDRAGDR